MLGAGSEDEREPRAEECVQPLAAGKSQETDSPLAPPEGIEAWQHLDSGLRWPMDSPFITS